MNDFLQFFRTFSRHFFFFLNLSSNIQNAPFNHAGGLAAKNAAVGLTRRPALGNLVNRAPKPNAVVAEPLKKSVIVNTENDYHPVLVDLKKVKPRVDTHWTKPVTRSTTLKAAINVKATETSSVLTAAPKLVKTRTTTTASIKEVKYVSSTKTTTAVAKKEKSNSPVRQVSIKREESNLSGKTLTKIRTSAAKLVAAKTANVLKVKVSNSDVAIKKKVQTSVEPKVEAVESNYRPAHSANMLGEVSQFNIRPAHSPRVATAHKHRYSYLHSSSTISTLTQTMSRIHSWCLST